MNQNWPTSLLSNDFHARWPNPNPLWWKLFCLSVCPSVEATTTLRWGGWRSSIRNLACWSEARALNLSLFAIFFLLSDVVSGRSSSDESILNLGLKRGAENGAGLLWRLNSFSWFFCQISQNESIPGFQDSKLTWLIHNPSECFSVCWATILLNRI